MSLLKKIKLSDDWRAHAWILSHCWPEQLSESRLLQPAQPTEPSLQINYGAGMSEVLEQATGLRSWVQQLKPGQKIDPRPEAQQKDGNGAQIETQEEHQLIRRKIYNNGCVEIETSHRRGQCRVVEVSSENAQRRTSNSELKAGIAAAVISAEFPTPNDIRFSFQSSSSSRRSEERKFSKSASSTPPAIPSEKICLSYFSATNS